MWSLQVPHVRAGQTVDRSAVLLIGVQDENAEICLLDMSIQCSFADIVDIAAFERHTCSSELGMRGKLSLFDDALCLPRSLNRWAYSTTYWARFCRRGVKMYNGVEGDGNCDMAQPRQNT